MLRRARIAVAAAACGVLFLSGALAPTPAAARLGKGTLAPDFEGKTFINTEEVSLRDLRGRMVLLELFATG